MKDKRGISTLLAILIGVVLVILGGLAVWGGITYLAAITPPAVPLEYDGEFSDVDVPQNVPGTDVAESVAYAEDTDTDTFNATLVTTSDVNGTDGQIQYLAFMFEVKGGNGFEALDIDGELSDCLVTEGVIKNAYILMDEEGLTLDKSDAIYTATVDTDLDKFDFELGAIAAGEYVLVVEWKGINTTALGTEGLVDVEFDADTDGDIDEGTVHLTNA